jgi:hypothetical protein
MQWSVAEIIVAFIVLAGICAAVINYIDNRAVHKNHNNKLHRNQTDEKLSR